MALSVIWGITCFEISKYPCSLSIKLNIYPPPPEQTPHPSPGSRPPRGQCMLGDTGNKRAVCILLECILVHSIFPLVSYTSYFCTNNKVTTELLPPSIETLQSNKNANQHCVTRDMILLEH